MGDIALGMWISMGGLLLAMGERPDVYSARFRRIAVCAPVAAASYLLGWLSEATPVVTILVMTVIALVGGIVSGYSGPLSIASMQGMLTAAIAIGVPAAQPYWPAAVWFIAGALLFAGLLGIEALLNRRRPQRTALIAVVRALADLARAVGAGRSDVAAEQSRAIGAINVYERMELALRGAAQGPTREYARAAVIVRAADQLLARLMAHDALPGLCAAAAVRLDADATALARRASGPRPAPQGTLVRVAMLEDALWGSHPSPAAPAMANGVRLRPPSRALVVTAVRLALCTALAYVALFTVPLAHAYWIALTVALVMKPDLGSVFSRAALRSAGTVAGAVIAIGVGTFTSEPLLLCLAIAVLAAILPWAAARSYALQALFLTPLIMVLLSMVGHDESVVGLAVARTLTTLIGSVIVVIAGYLIWPSARHAAIASPFATALAALADYAGAVAPGTDAPATTAARRRVYRDLSAVGVAVQQTLAEPPPAGREAAAWIPVVAAAGRVADRITDASASRPPLDVSADGVALTAIALDLASMAHLPRAERATRAPMPPAHGGEAADAVVRELADEVANLRPMLTRGGAVRATSHGRPVEPR